MGGELNKCNNYLEYLVNFCNFFTEMAKKYSEDPSVARNGGYLGYIKGFMTVYPFEEVAFTTKVGEVSEPVLS